MTRAAERNKHGHRGLPVGGRGVHNRALLRVQVPLQPLSAPVWSCDLVCTLQRRAAQCLAHMQEPVHSRCWPLPPLLRAKRLKVILPHYCKCCAVGTAAFLRRLTAVKHTSTTAPGRPLPLPQVSLTHLRSWTGLAPRAQ